MKLITLDFETFYGDDYTLSKMTTEAYVRDPRFEAILCSFKVDDNPTFWIDGPRFAEYLPQLDLENNAAVMHHAHFDALILNHHYGIRPKRIIDTLGMARAIYGANSRLSLAKLCEREGIGAKGDEVHNVKGMRFADFDYQALRRYAAYGCNDTDKTHLLAMRFMPQFSPAELQINDMVIRMFTEPRVKLNADLLREYLAKLQLEKATLMLRAGVNRSDLMSNEKFAHLLIEHGVPPPRKLSPTTGKPTYAFAKTDPQMQELAEHPDENVQFLIAARLGAKSTLAETRAQRLIDMSARGRACIYLKYSGASGTHRLSGGDKTNLQNLTRGSPLRDALEAEEGSVIVVGDSSNIEARVLDCLAGQDDMVEIYRLADRKLGPDVYCAMAGRIYKRTISKIEDPFERQMGKVAKLGLGFGMGNERFRIAVRAQAKGKDGKPLVITQQFAQEVVDIYRDAHPQVKKLWRRGEDALRAILDGRINVPVDYQGIVRTCKDGLVMPGGLKMLYPDLKFVPYEGQRGGEWSFWNGKMREHIYGAKLIENIVQCLARIIVFEQCRKTANALVSIAKWVHSVHDEGVFVANVFEAPYVLETLLNNMRIAPAWFPGLPVNSEGGFHRSYGKAKS